MSIQLFTLSAGQALEAGSQPWLCCAERGLRPKRKQRGLRPKRLKATDLDRGSRSAGTSCKMKFWTRRAGAFYRTLSAANGNLGVTRHCLTALLALSIKSEHLTYLFHCIEHLWSYTKSDQF